MIYEITDLFGEIIGAYESEEEACDALEQYCDEHDAYDQEFGFKLYEGNKA